MRHTILVTRDYPIDIRHLILVASLTACVADPTVVLVDGDTPAPPVYLLHGAGESGSDVSARWGMSAIAPDSTELADLETLIASGPRAIVMGQGVGASRAYELACSRPDLVGAIVMLSGEATSTPCAPGPRVSTLTVHGTLDDVDPYSTAAATFTAAQTLTGCTDVATFVSSPALTPTVEALACNNGPLRAEHWRVIGWDHNPALGEQWGEAVGSWIDQL